MENVRKNENSIGCNRNNDNGSNSDSDPFGEIDPDTDVSIATSDEENTSESDFGPADTEDDDSDWLSDYSKHGHNADIMKINHTTDKIQYQQTTDGDNALMKHHDQHIFPATGTIKFSLSDEVNTSKGLESGSKSSPDVVDREEQLKLYRLQQHLYLQMHKLHLLCLLGNLVYRRSFVESPIFTGISYPMVTDVDVSNEEKKGRNFRQIYQQSIAYQVSTEDSDEASINMIMSSIVSRRGPSWSIACACVALLQKYSIRTRLVHILNPISKSVPSEESILSRRSSTNHISKKPKRTYIPMEDDVHLHNYGNRATTTAHGSSSSSQRKWSKNAQLSQTIHTKQRQGKRQSTHRCTAHRWWLEVQFTKGWTYVDPIVGVVGNLSSISKRGNRQLVYVVGAEASHIKDVTKRYATNTLTRAFKQARVDDTWWTAALRPLQNFAMIEEDGVEETDLHSKPIGLVKGHLVYHRNDVSILRSREQWLRLCGKVVPENAIPVRTRKTKKARSKQDDSVSDAEIPLFGEWQTQNYERKEISSDGSIPINEHGNIELFHPSMLPLGGVHLNGRPGIGKVPRAIVAKQLGIPFANAVVGFEYKRKCCVPRKDGIVVSTDTKDILHEAWLAYHQHCKEEEKNVQRNLVIQRWETLVRKMLI
eukprot:gene7867-9975_t